MVVILKYADVLLKYFKINLPGHRNVFAQLLLTLKIFYTFLENVSVFVESVLPKPQNLFDKLNAVF